MLLAVTPNPSIDRILELGELRPGGVHRAETVRISPGGKGLNVVRAALRLGADAEAVCPLAGTPGRHLAELAAAEGLPLTSAPLAAGETRTCLLVNHDGADTTVINEPGPEVDEAGWEAWVQRVLQRAEAASAIGLCGSFPPGVTRAHRLRLITLLRRAGRPVYVDTSAAALADALGDPAGLTFKVNRKELREASGAAADKAPELLAAGAAGVLVTAGDEGAVAVTANGQWRALPPRVASRSSVGSGDAFLAGFAVARMRGLPVPDALRLAVACGAANTLSRWPGDLDPATVNELEEAVEVEAG